MTPPTFTTSEAVTLTGVDLANLKNWLHNRHADCAMAGKVREFNFRHLLKIEVLSLLTQQFRVAVGAAAEVADTAIAAYDVSGDMAADVLDVLVAGAKPAAIADRKVIELVRGDDGELRVQQPGDADLDTVGLVLPLRLIARTLAAKVRDHGVAKAQEAAA